MASTVVRRRLSLLCAVLLGGAVLSASSAAAAKPAGPEAQAAPNCDTDGTQPKNQLRGTLVDFGYDARTSSVVVTYDAVRDVNGTQVRTKRFSATVPGVVAEAAPVGAALNQAANQVANEVADWVG